MTARQFMLALAAGLLSAFSAAPSLAQDYPNHAVRIVVPFGAGGPADVAARLIGNALQESFGQPFVIENRTGAGGRHRHGRSGEVAGRRLHAVDDVQHPDRKRIPADAG
ncbi:tripartite-type tricarboxylate transporter receptor subunit TctC [Bradyrhizobium sp. LM2.9]